MRAPMVPTLAQTLGVKGHRPVVGTQDNKDLLHVFGSINAVDGRLHTSTLASSAKMLRDQRLAGNRQQVSKTRRMTLAFARHLQAVAAAYPTDQHQQVVMVIDNAPWHRGPPVREVLSRNRHLRLHRLPPYSPKLNVIERLWKWLRYRATHNRMFDSLKQLKTGVADAVRHLQRVPDRVLKLIGSWPQPVAENQTFSGGV